MNYAEAKLNAFEMAQFIRKSHTRLDMAVRAVERLESDLTSAITQRTNEAAELTKWPEVHAEYTKLLQDLNSERQRVEDARKQITDTRS